MLNKSVSFDMASGKLQAGTITATLLPWTSAGPLQKVSCSETESVWKNECGTWTFQGKTTQTGLALRLSAALKAPCYALHFGWMAEQPLTLTHLLGMGEKMGRSKLFRLPVQEETPWLGTCLAVLTNGADHLLTASPLRNPAWTVFSGTVKGNALHDFKLDCRIADDAGMTADTGWIEFSLEGDPHRRMTDWADANITKHKDFSKGWVAGWNSWDYYRWTITEDEVLKNARFIANDPVLSKYIKRIIVDDGWQYCYGEWEANPFFPHGMKYLADELKKLGFEPGLWIAPTIIEPHCRLALMNKELFALSEGGQPCLGFSCMRRYGLLLDPTVPEACKYISDVFDRYASMGYTYFKLDFMGSTLEARRFHDPSVPRTEIPRLIVKAVQDGVKGRAQILGCNYCFCGGNEFVDTVRIGADIHSVWGKMKLNSESIASLFHLNGRLWLNDPDFTLARGPETSDDPDMNRMQPLLVYTKPEDPYDETKDHVIFAGATKAEAQVLISLVIVSGGVMNLSDNLPLLNEKGLDLLRKAVAAEHGPAGVPLDLFEQKTPGVWMQELPDKTRILLINWNDQPQKMKFDLKGHQVAAVNGKDFWTGETVSAENGILNAELPPHHCLLAEF